PSAPGVATAVPAKVTAVSGDSSVTNATTVNVAVGTVASYAGDNTTMLGGVVSPAVSAMVNVRVCRDSFPARSTAVTTNVCAAPSGSVRLPPKLPLARTSKVCVPTWRVAGG